MFLEYNHVYRPWDGKNETFADRVAANAVAVRLLLLLLPQKRQRGRHQRKRKERKRVFI